MIIRVWGIVNSIEVEFTPIPDRPGYWEGTAPRMPGLQEIEIWAESSTGARGHLQCEVMIEYHAHTEAQLLQDCTEADLSAILADLQKVDVVCAKPLALRIIK